MASGVGLPPDRTWRPASPAVPEPLLIFPPTRGSWPSSSPTVLFFVCLLRGLLSFLPFFLFPCFSLRDRPSCLAVTRLFLLFLGASVRRLSFARAWISTAVAATLKESERHENSSPAPRPRARPIPPIRRYYFPPPSFLRPPLKTRLACARNPHSCDRTCQTRAFPCRARPNVPPGMRPPSQPMPAFTRSCTSSRFPDRRCCIRSDLLAVRS